jgi:hypothetical protein
MRPPFSRGTSDFGGTNSRTYCSGKRVQNFGKEDNDPINSQADQSTTPARNGFSGHTFHGLASLR